MFFSLGDLSSDDLWLLTSDLQSMLGMSISQESIVALKVFVSFFNSLHLYVNYTDIFGGNLIWCTAKSLT